jgi:hypothetical protein
MADERTSRLSQAIIKARRGEPLSPDERRLIQEGMKSVAPSSPEFRQLSEALSAAGTPSPQAPRYDGPMEFGPPTMDWAADLGVVKDAVTNEFQDPFGGNPDLRTYSDPSWEPNDGTGNQTPDRHANDPSPIPPGASTKNINYESMNGGIPGPKLAAGYGSEREMGDDDIADVNAITFPGGYSFSGSNETAVDMFKYNPELFNKNLTENVLDQPGMEDYWGNKTAAAMNMANYGLLGNGSGRSDLGGGPTTTTGQLAATEDFMKQFAQPGVQTVDPGEIYQQIFQRALATDWDAQSSRQGDGPMGKEEQIAVTNEALLTSMGFSNPETEAWMSSLLENAAMEYMMYLAQGGDTSVSYPKFLDETMGFSDLL